MELKDRPFWQIQQIHHMKRQGATLEDISEKTGVPLADIKKELEKK